MDDEIEILEEIKVRKVEKNPNYKESKTRITFLEKCRFCNLSFDSYCSTTSKKKLYKHCALKHYRSYLESVVRCYFKVHWNCLICFDELNSAKQALLHVAISHGIGTVLVIKNNFQKAH